MYRLLSLLFAIAVGASLTEAEDGISRGDYGVDESYPMHYPRASRDDRQAEYEKLINGCVDTYGKKGPLCWQNEVDRIAMSLRQPQSMVNYTNLVSFFLFSLLLLWETNQWGWLLSLQ